MSEQRYEYSLQHIDLGNVEADLNRLGHRGWHVLSFDRVGSGYSVLFERVHPPLRREIEMWGP